MSLWSQDFCLKNGPNHQMAVLFPSIGTEFLSSRSGMSEYKGQFLDCQKESHPSAESVSSTGVISLARRPGTSTGVHGSRQDVSSIPADLEN